MRSPHFYNMLGYIPEQIAQLYTIEKLFNLPSFRPCSPFSPQYPARITFTISCCNDDTKLLLSYWDAPNTRLISLLVLPLCKCAVSAGRYINLVVSRKIYGSKCTIAASPACSNDTVKGRNIPSISTMSATIYHSSKDNLPASFSPTDDTYHISMGILSSSSRYSIQYTLFHLVTWSTFGLKTYINLN